MGFVHYYFQIYYWLSNWDELYFIHWNNLHLTKKKKIENKDFEIWEHLYRGVFCILLQKNVLLHYLSDNSEAGVTYLSKKRKIFTFFPFYALNEVI